MNEQRKYLRLPLETRTFIELEAADSQGNESSQLIACFTEGVSRGGLHIAIAVEVTQNTILQIGVDIPGATSTLYLAAEAKWCLPYDDKAMPWRVGFKVLNNGDSDIERWVDLLISLEA